jgi:tetratricopeptide (TPR) repeat protein
MVVVAMLMSAIAGPMRVARSGDDEQRQAVAAQGKEDSPLTCVTILRQAIAATAGEPAKDSLLRTIAATLARGGHADEALRLAGADHKEEFKESIIRVTAIALARSGDFTGALRTARLLQAPESRQVTAIIAALQAWSGDSPGARRTIEAELKHEPESAFALRMIAQAQEEAGDFAGAAQTYESIPSLKEKARGRRPAARARLKAGDIPGALRAAEESRRLTIDYLAQKPPHKGQASSMPFDIKPDSFRDGILGEIALEQARMGDGLGARKTAESITGHYPRALTVAKAAAILARAGDRAAAKALIKWTFNLVDVVGLRGFELTEIATAETLAGETEAARKTFIRALGTVGPAVMNQSIVPDAQARAGDLEGAMQTLEAIGDLKARQRALRYMARTLAKAGNVRKAVEIAESILSTDDRALSLQEVSEAQAEAGDRAVALTTVRRAMAIDGPLDGETMRAVACASSELGDARGALEWVKARSTPATKSRALLGVAEGMLPKVRGPNLQGENP